MRKLFLLCIALILSLALCGAGFAYFSDTETIEGTITAGTWDVGGTIGFWKNWDKHNTYTPYEINGFLAAISTTSLWLGPTTVEGMEDMLSQNCDRDMQCKFLKHYLATRLNAESGRLHLDFPHNVTSKDLGNYLALTNPSSATLSDVVAAIESKYLPPDAEDAEPLTNERLETMKDICDALNKLEI